MLPSGGRLTGQALVHFMRLNQPDCYHLGASNYTCSCSTDEPSACQAIFIVGGKSHCYPLEDKESDDRKQSNQAENNI